MKRAIVKCPLGWTVIEADEEGVSKVFIVDHDAFAEESRPQDLEDIVQQIHAYFKGDLKAFKVNLHLQGTEFQKKVWDQLLNIPYGETRSYKQIASALGDEKAVRAVASANGRNPLWLLIPCHRVVGSDGKLTGYAGGLWRKDWLLQHEQGMSQGFLSF